MTDTNQPPSDAVGAQIDAVLLAASNDAAEGRPQWEALVRTTVNGQVLISFIIPDHVDPASQRDEILEWMTDAKEAIGELHSDFGFELSRWARPASRVENGRTLARVNGDLAWVNQADLP